MRGVAPSTPTRGIAPGPSRAIGPAPSSGTYSSYLTNHFPLKQEKPADASEKRLPCVKGAVPQGLGDCRHPSKKHAKTLGKSKLQYCELDAPLASAHGPAAACRPPDAKHPGKTEKGAGGNLFPATPFFVFIGPVVLFLFVSSNEHAKTTAFDNICFIALRVQGQWPCRGVQGLRKPLPWSASASGFLS